MDKSTLVQQLPRPDREAVVRATYSTDGSVLAPSYVQNYPVDQNGCCPWGALLRRVCNVAGSQPSPHSVATALKDVGLIRPTDVPAAIDLVVEFMASFDRGAMTQAELAEYFEVTL